LHDCGETFGAQPDAPKQTIEALTAFIPYALERGYRFVKAEEMIRMTEQAAEARGPGLLRRAVTSVWMAWEHLFHVLLRLKPVVSDDPRSFLFYRVTVYRGRPLPLPDGETLRPGDRIVELHMNNELLREIGRNARSSLQLAIQLIRKAEESMPALAAAVAGLNDPSVKAALGTSLVNRGPERFGFAVEDLPPGPFAWFAQRYLKILLSVIHPRGKNRLEERSELLVPKQIYISTRELLRRYGRAAEEVAAASSEPS